MDISRLPIDELFKLYADILDALIRKKICRTHNPPAGDYAEWLVSNAFNLKLQPKSAKGFDAIDAEGVKYQIKARWLYSDKASGLREMGVIRDLEQEKFDYLIAVLFSKDFSVFEAYKIPHSLIEKFTRFNKYVRGRILILKGPITSAEGVERVEEKLRNYLSSLLVRTSKMQEFRAA
jgi:hypothetical protein